MSSLKIEDKIYFIDLTESGQNRYDVNIPYSIEVREGYEHKSSNFN